MEYSSEDQRISDTILFLLAGYDTTAHSLCWVLIELLSNPSTLSSLLEELDKVAWGESVLQERGSELKHLSYCIKEAGRMWPVVGAGIYSTNKQGLSLCGCHTPKGSVRIHGLTLLFRTCALFLPSPQSLLSLSAASHNRHIFRSDPSMPCSIPVLIHPPATPPSSFLPRLPALTWLVCAQFSRTHSAVPGPSSTETPSVRLPDLPHSSLHLTFVPVYVC